VCLIVYDLETSTVRRLRPEWGFCAVEKYIRGLNLIVPLLFDVDKDTFAAVHNLVVRVIMQQVPCLCTPVLQSDEI
jgi:hypothetical protein